MCSGGGRCHKGASRVPGDCKSGSVIVKVMMLPDVRCFLVSCDVGISKIIMTTSELHIFVHFGTNGFLHCNSSPTGGAERYCE